MVEHLDLDSRSSSISYQVIEGNGSIRHYSLYSGSYDSLLSAISNRTSIEYFFLIVRKLSNETTLEDSTLHSVRREGCYLLRLLQYVLPVPIFYPMPPPDRMLSSATPLSRPRFFLFDGRTTCPCFPVHRAHGMDTFGIHTFEDFINLFEIQ